MRALVTGATGFIGGYLVRALIERGDRVTALVRTPDRAQHLKELGATLVPGDVTEPSTLPGPMRKADAVFHLAGWYQIGIVDRAKMYQINVRGTEHVLKAAVDAGIGQIVHVSSVAALGRQPIGEIATETTPHPGSFHSAYEETKWQAHRHARAVADAGAPVVIAMPGVVYGPGDHSAVGRLIRMYAKGWLIACPYQDTGMSWVHVADVAEGILATHDNGKAGQDYILGGDNLSIRDLLATMEPITGIRAPRFDVPRWMMRATAPLAPVIGLAMRAGPRVSSEGRATMDGSWMAFSTKAMRDLGYTYRGVAEAMPETILWFREN